MAKLPRLLLQPPPQKLPHLLLPGVVNQLYQLRVADFPAAELDYLRYSATVDGARAREVLRFKHRYNAAEAIRAALRLDIFDGAVERRH